jgi:hypothetical protein
MNRKPKQPLWNVRLTDGADWDVRAASKAEAIKKATAGKGRKVGQYFETTKNPKAFRSK